MIVKIKRTYFFTVIGVLILFAAIALIIAGVQKEHFYLGGLICSSQMAQKSSSDAVIKDDENRFQRPSQDKPYPLKYDYEDVKSKTDFDDPKDLIEAYYAVLKEASNMKGYAGGCGTVGNALEPYPYAYKLTSSGMSLSQFIDSFKGIGHITLLKLSPAYAPAGTPENIKNYFAEIEVITGPGFNPNNKQPSFFAYYYGLITTEKTPDGWKIKSVNYIPEDFLCAPYHQWSWDSQAILQIIYKEQYKLVENITKTEKNDSYISIYASGKGNNYRFDFVRLTNGEDILLHEYIERNGKWEETNFLIKTTSELVVCTSPRRA